MNNHFPENFFVVSKKYRFPHQHEDYGENYIIATCLLDGPKTVEQIAEQMLACARRFGFYEHLFLRKKSDREFYYSHLQEQLEQMIQARWIQREGPHYFLTETGREEGHKPLQDFRRLRQQLNRAVQPETVSKVSLMVHLVLAGIKLPAGLISGSVGLINDAIDTLLDGLACLMVYFGFRLQKERLANRLLVLMMLVTGGIAFYEAVKRIFAPEMPVVDWFTFLATLFSAFACLLLYFYQRYVGLKIGSLTLITQSVDSRNHVIVAISVTAGLIATLIDFLWLDLFVGLVVAILILKSALELLVEIIRNPDEEAIDLSRYYLGITEKYKQFQHHQMRHWVLYLIGKQGLNSREKLSEYLRQALDFQNNITLREIGFAQQFNGHENIQDILVELSQKGWIEERHGLVVTEAGRKQLQKWL